MTEKKENGGWMIPNFVTDVKTRSWYHNFKQLEGAAGVCVYFVLSGGVVVACSSRSGKNPGSATGVLFPHKVHLVLLLVVDLKLGEGAGGLGDELAFAQAPRVGEELFLEVFGDPLLDDDVVAVEL